MFLLKIIKTVTLFLFMTFVFVLLPSSASSDWLEFSAGCPEGSSPLTLHNITLPAELISFDVELRGLQADTIEHDGISYLRFTNTPGTRPMEEVGYPELPVVTCFVAVPDSTDLALIFSADCPDMIHSLPVYPSPLDSLRQDSTCTPYIDEFFRKDSAAYISTQWYPDVHATLSGEFRLRDKRVAIVDVYPVQYLASEDSIRVWSDIELVLTFEDSTAEWPSEGLGPYDRLIGDNLLGYTPSFEYTAAVDGQVYRPENLVTGPPVVPDYVIIIPWGLDGIWIDTFAQYRAGLNGFDVAIVRTDDIYDQFNKGAPHLTQDVIRNFTEAMWAWGNPGDRPTYLLLIGDHEEHSCFAYPGFLPTKESGLHGYGNDEWFVLFGEPRETVSAFPDMIVGRLSVRDTDTLRDMFALIVDYESEVELPGPAYRRYITRLAGAMKDSASTEDEWSPSAGWTDSLRQWMGYDWDNYYCGDGENDPPNPDGSSMTSSEWVDICETVFERGSQVAFYTDHGDFHMFSAGLNWETGGPDNFGVPDSSFDDIDVIELNPIEGHWHPFVLMLCCGAGTFNHTHDEHLTLNTFRGLCYDYEANPPYDFYSDCLAEDFIRNTDCGAIAVFAGSNSSHIGFYDYYGRGILEAIFHNGNSRAGDAILEARINSLSDFWNLFHWVPELAQFNLLGDPAVDIGDRVKFRNCCDLIISPDDLEMNRYPTMPVSGGSGEPEFQVTVRNAGAVASGAFSIGLQIVYEGQTWTTGVSCDGLLPGEKETLQFTWSDPPSGVSGGVHLAAIADPQENTPDSWRPNNSAETEVTVLDFYPNQEGWPVRTYGSIKTPPALADLDGDGDMEIVTVMGDCLLAAYKWDNPSSPLWITDPYPFSTSIPSIGNVCGDELPEVIIDGVDFLFVFSGTDGELLYSFAHPVSNAWRAPHSVCLSDLEPEDPEEISREEIAVVLRNTLYIFRVQNNQLEVLDAEELISTSAWTPFSCVSATDLNGSGPDELIINRSRPGSDPQPAYSRLDLYDYASGHVYSREVWEEEYFRGIPAVGSLPASGERIALSRGKSSHTYTPVYIIDPEDLESSLSCEEPSRSSTHVLCCMMADWVSPSNQADRIIANAENQACVWDEYGDIQEGLEIRYPTSGKGRPPFPALGELHNQDGYFYADLIVATLEGVVYAYSSTGILLEDLGFPYLLPSYISGGLVIADIDNDGRVEAVFGTVDNYLHVWELGRCVEGYSPWPQCQHDAARTGVLLEE